MAPCDAQAKIRELEAACAAKDAEIAALNQLTRLVLERAERVDKWTCGKSVVPVEVQNDALAIISLAADMLHPDAHQEPKRHQKGCALFIDRILKCDCGFEEKR